MSQLSNSRHELFAQELAQGKSAAEAYVEAGYTPDRHHAARLATNGHIKARVEEIQGRVAKNIGLSRDWVLEELVDNVNRAKAEEGKLDGATANRALELLGKELGMFVDRVIEDSNIRIVSETPQTAEEWEREYAPAKVDDNFVKVAH